MPELTKYRLIAEAVRRHGDISIIRGDLDGAFSVVCGRALFWFNTPDGSTHIAQEVLHDIR